MRRRAVALARGRLAGQLLARAAAAARHFAQEVAQAYEVVAGGVAHYLDERGCNIKQTALGQERKKKSPGF